jgi:hypothetical protein
MPSTPQWTGRFPSEPSPDDDRATLKNVADAMEQRHNELLEPGETTEFLPSIKRGGIAHLLEHRFGRTGDVETQRRMDMPDDAISYYQELLAHAVAQHKFSDDDLKALHARINRSSR